VVIVAGSDARHGRNHGLVLRRLRLDDGTELAATEHFRAMGGYLRGHPS
jgi:methionyl-tRNA formyltransferase